MGNKFYANIAQGNENMNWYMCLNLKSHIKYIYEDKVVTDPRHWKYAVADLHSKILDARPQPQVQILSISCSFWENLQNRMLAPLPGELAPPPRGNPGFATAMVPLTPRNRG